MHEDLLARMYKLEKYKWDELRDNKQTVKRGKCRNFSCSNLLWTPQRTGGGGREAPGLVELPTSTAGRAGRGSRGEREGRKVTFNF